MSVSVGRPRRASKALLQEAAFELFQHRGYRATSVEQIAKLAGFSRATFFNFFSSKAELFWLETDALVASMRNFLDEHLATETPHELPQALLEYAERLGSEDIPWALQNYSLLEASDDLIASGASRVLGVNRIFLHYMIRREGVLQVEQPTEPSAQAAKAAVLATLQIMALLAWIDAGVGRGSLRGHLQRVFRATA